MRADLIPHTYGGTLIRVISEAAEAIEAISHFHDFCGTGEPVRRIIDLAAAMTDTSPLEMVRVVLSEYNDLDHAMHTLRTFFYSQGHGIPEVPPPPAPTTTMDRGFIQVAAKLIHTITKLQLFGECPTDAKTGIAYDNVADALKCMEVVYYHIGNFRNLCYNHGISVPMPDIPIPNIWRCFALRQ